MNTTELFAVALATLLLATGVAAASPADGGQDTVRIVDEEFTVSDATITVSGTTISGPGLPDTRVEGGTYTLDSTVHVEGLDITHDGTTYVLCDATVHVEDVGVHLEDVTLSSG